LGQHKQFKEESQTVSHPLSCTAAQQTGRHHSLSCTAAQQTGRQRWTHSTIQCGSARLLVAHQTTNQVFHPHNELVPKQCRMSAECFLTCDHEI